LPPQKYLRDHWFFEAFLFELIFLPLSESEGRKCVEAFAGKNIIYKLLI